jgi:hypothetical protein
MVVVVVTGVVAAVVLVALLGRNHRDHVVAPIRPEHNQVVEF